MRQDRPGTGAGTPAGIPAGTATGTTAGNAAGNAAGPGEPTDGAGSPAGDPALRARVDAALGDFLAEQQLGLGQIGAGDLDPVLDALRDLLGHGGKRLRPAFCYWGWRGAGGPDCAEIVVASAALELLQAGALIHDDYIDASDTRRGRPAAHRRFAALHRSRGWAGDADGFGAAAAIILGDLCLSWCDEMFERSGLPVTALFRAKPVFQLMRTEVMAGQYLDVLGQHRGGPDVDAAMRVVRYKAAKYTIERPLHVGGLLAGADPALVAAYSGYGLPLGEAFQLRDDILGVFGDPVETGKPAGDDLREGKQTVLVALAYRQADAAARAALDAGLGDRVLDPVGVDRLRTILTETGAVAEVERMIEARTGQAQEALRAAATVEPAARAALERLAVAATTRRV
ncbi:MAG: polyprenyl synthetase family protein [Sporichthyaceae bacterium]|nr:polyprenyl synthetase family protein [Sporichthyaceae bacterium]